MRYLSVCSGIEAASCAWKPLGWDAVAFAEIEPFPCRVLQHHFPDVPNMGDMTKIKGDEYHNLVCIPINTQVGTRHRSLGERTGLGIGKTGDPAFTLQAGHSHAVCAPVTTSCYADNAAQESKLVPSRMGVRRLTPLECERLQSFPDGWTDIPGASDTARYKALGNSMCVNVMRWIGERIERVERQIVGTTDSPTPKWEPKPGELVAVSDTGEEDDWEACIYRGKSGRAYEGVESVSHRRMERPPPPPALDEGTAHGAGLVLLSEDMQIR